MLDAKIRGYYDHVMKPVGGALSRGGLDPNLITVAGVGLQGAVAVLILGGNLFAAGLVAILAGVADSLDGAVAKASGGARTKFGALLDSTVDRLSDALFFLPLTWLYGVAPDPARRDQTWVAALALVALVGSFLVSYVKARAEGLGYECNVGIAERAERLILIVAGLILNLVPVMLATLALLAVVTFVQRILYVRAQMSSAG